jgi:hypothetical protein
MLNLLPAFDARLVDAILALVAIEAVALVWRRRVRGRGPTTSQTLSFLGSGAALLVALRGTLAGWPVWVALAALLAGGMAHVVHLLLDARLDARSGE